MTELQQQQPHHIKLSEESLQKQTTTLNLGPTHPATHGVFQSSRATKNVIFHGLEERLSILRFLLESLGVVEVLCVLLEGLNRRNQRQSKCQPENIHTGQLVQLSKDLSLPGSTVSTAPVISCLSAENILDTYLGHTGSRQGERRRWSR